MWIRGLLLSPSVALLAAPLVASAAPAQLYGKTITLSWHAVGVSSSDDGRTVYFDHLNTRTVYVSSAGRLFTRGVTSLARNEGFAVCREHGPDDKKVNNEGLAAEIRFDGGKLVGIQQFARGAGQIVATFNSSFSSCTLSVVYGRIGGSALRVRALDGKMYDVQSISAVSPTCSISDGNALADH